MTRFRRLVLELGHGAADPETIREAAAFAQLLDAELYALFVEDETLLHASALPFTREISPLSYQWRSLEPAQLEAELKAAADQARRHIEAAARATGIRRSFEVRRGDLALHVTNVCVASDIVIVSSQRRMGTGTARGFLRLRDAACQSVASVLHLPPTSARKQGVVVAVAVSATDPAVDIARWIATEAHERLLVLAPAGTVIERGPDIRFLSGTSDQDVIATLGDIRERLIVMTRTSDGEDPGSALAAARGVPVLVMEPI
jgi:nucleotide-binding universal stress UspA family protein